MHTHKLLPHRALILVWVSSEVLSVDLMHTKSLFSLSVELLVLQDTCGTRLAIKTKKTHSITCSEIFRSSAEALGTLRTRPTRTAAHARAANQYASNNATFSATKTVRLTPLREQSTCISR